MISMKNAAAIDQESLAGDKIALRGCKIDENAEQIFRGLQSLDRTRLQLKLGKLFGRVHAFVLNQAGGDGIYANAELAHLASTGSCHAHQRRFRSDIMQK